MLASVPVPSIAAAGKSISRGVTPIASQRSHRRASVRVQGQSKDAMCRDMVGERREVESQGKVYKINFIASGGETRQIECPDNMYILDAADQNGIDLPSTCRGGICGACVARVAKGSTDQSDIADITFTVPEEELEQGMALLCMARPTSDCDIETQCDWGYSLDTGGWRGATGRFSASPDPLMGKKFSELTQAGKEEAS
ncbi:putative ferredoxin [Dunaliella salina]|uniref:Ferredoxin n=1 Tax=Dunaliella salina TaxID=3046 RepID=A0ABQ7H850_DUNSA|nr:putative ferredoxin [Dunaliella salina]|eukprot:KAF5843027.1 putative ferredoxin [Dunaliella salina]